MTMTASPRFWKITLSLMLLVGVTTLGYTLSRATDAPVLPDGMVMPLLEAKSPEGATQDLVSHFMQARALSEDYLMETQAARLVSIEVEFDRRLDAIETELIRLGRSDDAGVEILVANLMRLKSTLERDAKTSFRQHRLVLGCGG